MSLVQQDSLAMAMMRSVFASQRAVLGLMASPALLIFQITTVTMGLMERRISLVAGMQLI
jgi:hypothetical protein